jgi:hypothetical protein
MGEMEATTFLGLVVSQLWMIVPLWIATWPRKLRGIVPITFAALLLFGLAPFLGERLAAAFGGGAHGPSSRTMFMLMALPIGLLAWLRLHQLSRDYERKRFSDAQLLARTWWLMLVVVVLLQLLTMAKESRWQSLAAAGVALFAFGPVNTWMFARLRATADARPAPTLLLLRVFGYAARTERLFDRVGARWRLFGPVTMIAAPDVAARTIDPGDYLRWLTGRIDESFVTSPADLDDRLAALDMAPDPDGLYRVNEFCCRDNTWQATVAHLMQRADVVVMDIRGLTRARRGSEFELRHLAQHYPLGRLVLVVDASTEHAILEEVFGAALSEVRRVEVRRRRDDAAVSQSALTALAERPPGEAAAARG